MICSEGTSLCHENWSIFCRSAPRKLYQEGVVLKQAQTSENTKNGIGLMYLFNSASSHEYKTRAPRDFTTSSGVSMEAESTCLLTDSLAEKKVTLIIGIQKAGESAGRRARAGCTPPNGSVHPTSINITQPYEFSEADLAAKSDQSCKDRTALFMSISGPWR